MDQRRVGAPMRVNAFDLKQYEISRKDPEACRLIELGEQRAVIPTVPFIKSLSGTDLDAAYNKPGQKRQLPRLCKQKMSKTVSDSVLPFKSAMAERQPRRGLTRAPKSGKLKILDPLARAYGTLVPQGDIMLLEADSEAKMVLDARVEIVETETQQVKNNPARLVKVKQDVEDELVDGTPEPDEDDSAGRREQVDTAKALGLGVELPSEVEGIEAFDQPDIFEDRTEQEWLDLYRMDPNIHCHVLHYEDDKWILKEAWVRNFDREFGRYECELECGTTKFVKRLSLRFTREDPKKWAARLQTARHKKESTHMSHKMLKHINSISDDHRKIAPMSTETKSRLIEKCTRLLSKTGAQNYLKFVHKLMVEVEGVYITAMKFATMKEQHITYNGFPHAYIDDSKTIFGDILQIWLPKPVRYYGLVTSMPEESLRTQERIGIVGKLLALRRRTRLLLADVHDRWRTTVSSLRFLDVERGNSAALVQLDSKLGMSAQMMAEKLKKIHEHVAGSALYLEDFVNAHRKHTETVTRLICTEWRNFIVSDVLDRLSDAYDFFAEDREQYLTSQLHTVLQTVELIMKSQLRTGTRVSVAAWANFMRSFLIRPLNRTAVPPPLVIVDIILKENKVVFKTPFDEVLQAFMQMAESICQSILEIKTVEPEIVPCLNLPLKPITVITKHHPLISQMLKIVSNVVTHNMKAPTELLEQYQQYEYLFAPIEEQVVNADPVNGLTELTKLIESFQRARHEIENISGHIEKFPMFEVRSAEIISHLTRRCAVLSTHCLEIIKRSAVERTAKLSADWKNVQNYIRAPVKNEKELSDMRKCMRNITDDVCTPQVAILRHTNLQIHVMDQFIFPCGNQLIEDVLSAEHWTITIKMDISMRHRDIDKETRKFAEQLKQDKIQFEADMVRWNQMFKTIKEDFVNYSECASYSKTVIKLHEEMTEGTTRLEDFNKRERLFGTELSDTEELQGMIDDYDEYYRLWMIGIDFSESSEEWTNATFVNLNAQEILENIDMWFKAAYKMTRQFQDRPKQLAVNEAIVAAITEFKKILPIIEACCHEAFAQRHWFDFFDQSDIDNSGDIGDLTFSLKQLLGVGVTDHIGLLEELAAGAQKEFSLRKSLAKMKEEWLPVMFEVFPYKETGTYLLKGLDDTMTLLDDHIVKTQAIRGSPFCRPFEKDCKDWEARLVYIQDTLDQILTCQRQWLYLEPIFSSDDIVRQMPNEAKKFKSVDARWRDTMAVIEENPGVLDLADIDNIFASFVDANHMLDAISKGLNDYLETKRLFFPRFFFLSNDELLSILSETKDPTRVQPHMNKCFEGIAKVRFDANNNIIEAMTSCESEVVDLFNPVDVNSGPNKGNVERWLLEVQTSMVHCLRQIGVNSMVAYAENPRTEWACAWPGQVVLLVDMAYWSAEVGEALTNKTLPDYFDVLQKQLMDIVALVRGELPKLNRQTLGAMTTIDVHNRDVVSSMVEKGVDTPHAFDWISQLRYYQAPPKTVIKNTGKLNEETEFEVKIVNSVLLYAFEYLGNSERLVITPLTDRCYRTLMGAMHLNYGGAPEGPAGTGKTESVKDLAKALAIQCVVFNCSDGLDFLAMGKFFKGLASSGAWCCFDEFNRINVEVLSVIAQQIMTIQFAILERKERFMFEGTDLQLVLSVAVNITMNPGYAGRAELPDNLKALFRPCAMMVPDYAMIGEIFLYAFGFEAAKDLGRKATQALRLSSEQLSPQEHYDFGMRGLKSLLVASGNMKRKYGDTMPEFTLALRGFLDVNLPKFTVSDIPLFNGIVSDLFPGVELPPRDTELFEKVITEVSLELNLHVTPNHLLKTIQLWETIVVRHGLMTVGLPPCGKTTINIVLAGMLEKLNDGDTMLPPNRVIINPKSIRKEELYGNFDDNTHEWSDGILAVAVRNATMAEPTHRQWLILDGPVDAIWIEDMNTVLDDNKKLCLLSGEIIKLSPLTSMMFEVADLAVASPATVSRCGMVLMEPENLSWRPQIQSWMNTLPDHLQHSRELIWTLFDSNLDAAVDFVRKLQLRIPSLANTIGLYGWLGRACARNMESLMSMHIPAPGGTGRVLNPKEQDARIPILFYFALLWSAGGILDDEQQKAFDPFLRDMIEGRADLVEVYGIVVPWVPVECKQQLPDVDKGTLYDFVIDEMTGKWLAWASRVKPCDIAPKTDFHTIIVPTVDTTRAQYLLDLVVKGGSHAIFTGITGTGKTSAVQNMLLKGFNPESYASMSFAFSAATTSMQTQDIIDGKLDKRRRGVFGPPLGKTMLIFVDDLNMPTKETFGAQPPLELLRQFMTQGGWYDLKSQEFRTLIDIIFLGAMGPPGGGKNDIPARYLWHYNVFFLSPYSRDGLSKIFVTIMKWFLSSNGFASSVTGAAPTLVASTIDIYDEVAKGLRPTPMKSHYTFNLRDLSKVFQGITLCTAASFENPSDFISAWAHEVSRIFLDRLVTADDEAWMLNVIKTKMEEHFKKKYAAVVHVEPLIMCDFLDVKTNVYKTVDSMPHMIARCDELLADYNAVASQQMNLALFIAFCEHVCRVVRVLKLPLGNMLCVGVGGSGRKSVTRLATFIVDYEIMSIEITKSYGTPDWCDDLRRLLINVGCKLKLTMFMFSDTQVQKETFLEDISSILNTGEVPNLFGAEDRAGILDACSKPANAEGCYSQAQIMSWFREQCRKNLHIALCLSPIGESFRTRLRNYPSLVNCCTIDWFKNWPEEALVAVGQQFLRPLFKVEKEDEHKLFDVVVKVCATMQSGAFDLAEKFRTVARRFYYVTPTSYLELVNLLVTLLKSKRESVSSAKNRYDVGLDKIASTEAVVTTMKQELIDLQPVLDATITNNTEKIIVIEKEQVEAGETKAIVEVEEAQANEQAEAANAMKADCQRDLDEALPAMESALAALKSLSKGDIVEVKAMKTPPAGVILVSEALCHMFKIKAMKVKSEDGMSKVDSYWEPAKKTLFGDSKLLQKLVEYDKDNIGSDVIAKVAPFEADPNFDPEVIKKASVAACGICKWIRAMIIYERVAKMVEPKRVALAKAESELQESMDKLAEKKTELKEVLDRLQALEDDFSVSKQKQIDLQAQVEDCKVKLSRAEKLIGGLGGEKGRWSESSRQLGISYDNLTGDVLVASGVIAYLGVFPANYREEQIATWSTALREDDITVSDNFALADVAGDPIVIRQWVIDRLPNDKLSIENGVMMSNSGRWPLMIDPQMQANRWIKTTSGEQLKVLRLTQPDYARTLETAIQFGSPVLFENVGETLDPMLEPLLQKAIFKAGSLSMIRLGDNTIEYSSDFRLYITSKLPNPHYAPEVCVTVLMLNFVTTFEGLSDGLLALLVAKEQPEMERRRQELVVESASSKAQLKQIEDRVLSLLSSASGNILDDEELIQTLSNSKVASVRIEERVVVQERTRKEIQETRNFYEPVAQRTSALFFVISDLSMVEFNYQYSLEWYVKIYSDSVDSAEKARGAARLDNLNKEFLRRLYENVCRSLFEKDKMLFSFLVSNKMLDFDSEVAAPELRLLLQGGGGGGRLEKPKPDNAPWVSDVMWGRILELTKLSAENSSSTIFERFDERFVEHLDAWHAVFDSDTLLETPWPEEFNLAGSAKCGTPVQRALIVLALRPDGVIAAIQDITREKLGAEYLEPPPFDLEICYQDSKPHIPLIFILTTGADPMTALLRLADKLNMKERITLLALGQGQGPKADAAIAEAKKEGRWVVLQNCHLATTYMPILEATCENFNPEELDPDFRLWLTGMPSETFPVSVLQNGIKMTVEPPTGLKANLNRAYLGFEDEYLNSCSKTHPFKKLLFGLAFFHSSILERRKFGPLGWNIPYFFSDQDRNISASQLKLFLDDYDEIQYVALNYLVAEANYGGRVTDVWDRRTIVCIADDFICPDILNEEYKFSTSGIYYSPKSKFTKNKYLDYIKGLPLQEHPEAFGMHQNADLTAKINNGMRVLNTAIGFLPRDSSGGGKTTEELYCEISQDILEQLPSELFDIEAVQRKFPIMYEESLNTVLLQELGRFNKLLTRVRASMINLQLAVKGDILMTPDLDDCGTAFVSNKVPDFWKAVSYPSLKPLGGYVADLIKRLKLFSDWITDGQPYAFWIPGLFFTQAFFTGVLQNFARKTKLPIDTLIWNFDLELFGFFPDTKIEHGCYMYGLYAEGGRWDEKNKVLGESLPKVLYELFPVIRLTPVSKDADQTPPSHYPCPIYKTLERRGVLSTTGHSTNFVMCINIPIAEASSEKYWVKRGFALVTALSE